MTKYRIDIECTVEIEVNDPTAITRCTENHTADGVPAGDGEKGWRDQLYDLRDRDDVLQHWAYNRIANGVEDAVRLDGWADMPAGTVEIDVVRGSLYYSPAEVEEVTV